MSDGYDGKWPSIKTTGTVLIHRDGTIGVEGFDCDHASCREAVNMALAWAMQQIAVAMRDQLSAEYPSRASIG